MFPKILANKAPKVLTFEIGNGYYKAAFFQEDKNGLMGLVKAEMAFQEEMSEQDIIEKAARFVDKNRLRGATAVNIIPSQYAIFKNIEIPSVDPKEIQQIIDLQSGTHTPYPKDEMVLDHLKISTYEERYTKVLLVITKRDVVTRRYDILRQVGVKAEEAYLSAEGMARFIAAERIKSKAPTGIVHIDVHSSDFVVVENGRPIYIRSVAIGGMDMETARAENCPLFIEELSKSMESYLANGISDKPQETLFTGVIEPFLGLLDEAGDVLGTEVEAMPYTEILKPVKATKKAVQANKELSLLTVVAPFLAKDTPELSLIPDDIRDRQELKKHSMEITKVGILAVLVFVLFCAILFTKIFFEHTYLTELKESYREENKEVEWLDNISSKSHRLDIFLRNKGQALSVLVKLYDAIPSSMFLESIAFDQEGKVVITGTAESMSQVFAMVTDIEDDRDFKNVRVDFTRTRRAGGREVADFGITMELE